MRALLPILLLGVGGCYSPATFGPGPSPSPESYSALHYGGAWYQEPLRASVWFDQYTGAASFEVNRPAHVALFALQPGGGMHMIYPAIGYGRQQAFTTGSHNVYTSARRSSHFASFSSHSSRAFGFAPTYIIMIASQRPLDIGPFMATGTMPWLNRASITSNPYTAAEVLATEIVPQASRTDWTVAYHVLWPQDLWGRDNYRPSYVYVVCPGNVILSVPRTALRYGLVTCPSGDVPQGEPGYGDEPLPKIGDRIAKRPDRPERMRPAESDVEVRETLRRVAEKRDRRIEDSNRALPSWRRATATRSGRPADELGEDDRLRGGGISPVLPRRPAYPATRGDGQAEARPGTRSVPVRVERPARPGREGAEPAQRPAPRAEPRSRPEPRKAEPPPRPAPRKAEPPSRPPPSKAEPPPPPRRAEPARPAPGKVERPSRPTRRPPPSRAERPSRQKVEPRAPRRSTPPSRPRRPPRPTKKSGGNNG